MSCRKATVPPCPCRLSMDGRRTSSAEVEQTPTRRGVYDNRCLFALPWGFTGAVDCTLELVVMSDMCIHRTGGSTSGCNEG